MTNDPLTERDLRARLSVPPTFDVGYHLRELARVLLPALLGALVVAGVVYLLVASQPAVYQNSVTAKIDSGATMAGMNDVSINTLAPPFVALSKSEAVLADVAKRAQVDVSPDELAKNIDVAVELSPSLVQVTTRASTPEQAIALSSAAVLALDNAIVNIWNDRVIKDVKDLQWSASQAAAKMVGLDRDSPEYLILHSEFDSQLERAKQLQSTPPTRIVLLSQSEEADKVAPLPLRETLVAFIASALILAEALAFLNGRVGRRTNAAWARRQAHRRSYAMAVADGEDSRWPMDTQVVLNTAIRHRNHALVLHSATPAAASFVSSCRAADVEAGGGTAALGVQSIDTDWWRDPGLVDSPVAMVVIDPRAVERKSMAKAFDALDRYEAAVQLLMLPSDIPTRIGRHRGTPAPEPIAEDADTAGIFDSGPAAVDFVRGTTEEHAHEST